MFGKIFAENCMKVKEIRPRRGEGEGFTKKIKFKQNRTKQFNYEKKTEFTTGMLSYKQWVIILR